MAKLTLDDVTAGYAASTRINANNAALEAALENTLSRDGTSPNEMEANLDMNSKRILNLGGPVNPTDAARYADLQGLLEIDGTIAVPALAGNEGKVLRVGTDATTIGWDDEAVTLAAFNDLMDDVVANTSAIADIADDLAALTTVVAAKQVAIQFADEGSDIGTIGAVTQVDFVGSGVTATHTGGVVTVTIPGPGSVIAVASYSFAATGFIEYDNGFIEQWGTATANANGATTVTYPKAFTSFGIPVISGGVSDAGAQDNAPAVVAAGLTTFGVYSARDESTAFWWHAKGV